MIKDLRNFFELTGAVQIDIPVLEENYGGARAHPFKTFANYNEKDYFLRVSSEFPCKRLIMAGFNEIFFLGSHETRSR